MQVYDFNAKAMHEANFVFRDESYIYIVNEYHHEQMLKADEGRRMFLSDIVISRKTRELVKSRFF